MIIHLISAARPNFMKIAPLYHALKKESWAEPIIVHTGQHYDINMSDSFFQDLMLPSPDIHLGVGSGTHAEQTGKVMIAYEKVIMKQKPDLVVVVGDVNSTIAATMAAVKLGVKTAHLEAGLRSYDRSMPEEINRLATDVLVDILWTPSPDADDNLKKEGIDGDKVQRVGNIMIDSFEMLRSKIEQLCIYRNFNVEKNEYGVVTLHRPANVDDPGKLRKLCGVLRELSSKMKLVFPVHPRTRKSLEKNGLYDELDNTGNIYLVEPMSYMQFMNLVLNCKVVITDSGGIQEETSYLGIPCFTLRPNTERPITITHGTNRLCSVDDVLEQVKDVLASNRFVTNAIPLWDGKTAQRVVGSIKDLRAGN